MVAGTNFTFGNGTASPTPTGTATTTSYNNLQASLVADVDLDGIPDIVSVYGFNAQSMGVARGLGNGTFGALSMYASTNASYPLNAVVTDVNHDGSPDVVVFDSGGNVATFVNMGCR